MSDILQGIAAVIGAFAGIWVAMKGFRDKQRERLATAQAAEDERAAAAATTAATTAAEAKKDGTDQLQEDLDGLRTEFRKFRADAARRDRYNDLVTRHLENEIGAMRAAWPAGTPLPPRPIPPRWEDSE